MTVDLTDNQKPEQTLDEYIHDKRAAKAQALADILWKAGWTPLNKALADADLLNAEKVRLAGRKGKVKMPSDDTKFIVARLLREKWDGKMKAERKGDVDA